MRSSPRPTIAFAVLFGLFWSVPAAAGGLGELQDRLRADLEQRIDVQSRAFLDRLVNDLADATLTMPPGWRSAAAPAARPDSPACVTGRTPGLDCLSPPLRTPQL